MQKMRFARSKTTKDPPKLRDQPSLIRGKRSSWTHWAIGPFNRIRYIITVKYNKRLLLSLTTALILVSMRPQIFAVTCTLFRRRYVLDGFGAKTSHHHKTSTKPSGCYRSGRSRVTISLLTPPPIQGQPFSFYSSHAYPLSWTYRKCPPPPVANGGIQGTDSKWPQELTPLPGRRSGSLFSLPLSDCSRSISYTVLV